MQHPSFCSPLCKALNGADLTNPIRKYRAVEPLLDQTRLRSEQVIERVRATASPALSPFLSCTPSSLPSPPTLTPRLQLQIFYFDQLDMLMLCERPSPVVSVYSPKSAACKHELRGHSAEVLAIESIDGAACIVTSGADLALCFWDVKVCKLQALATRPRSRGSL